MAFEGMAERARLQLFQITHCLFLACYFQPRFGLMQSV
jgi:hypothetical protein